MVSAADDFRLDPEFRRRSGFVGAAPLWRSPNGWVLVDRRREYPERVTVEVGAGDGASGLLDHAQAADMAVAVLRAVAVEVREECRIRIDFPSGREPTRGPSMSREAAEVKLAEVRRESAEDGDRLACALEHREVLTLLGGHGLTTAWEADDAT